MIIERKWAMPNKNTFMIKPIRELILGYKNDGVWIDPYANTAPLKPQFITYITNDLNPEYPTDYNIDAFDFLKAFDNNSIDGVLFDPPYSVRQVSECYKQVGQTVTNKDTTPVFWRKQKDEITRILKPGGVVVCCGWNSMGIGKTSGFKMVHILLVPHGGVHNDTIVTVERKEQLNLLTS